MRKIALVCVLLVLLTVAVMPASAQGVNIAGVSVFFSSGSEQCKYEGSMVFKGAISGRHLNPVNGILRPWREEPTICQLQLTRDDRGANVRPEDFAFFWATKACPRPEQMSPVGFNEDAGWTFTIDPARYKGMLFDTPLVLLVRVNGGKKDYVRVIFKFTYDKDPLHEQTLLWISPCDPPKPSAPAVQQKVETREDVDPQKLQAQLEDIRKAFEANLIDHKRFGELLTQLLESVGDLNCRLVAVETWVKQAIMASQANASVAPPPVVIAPVAMTLRQRLERDYAGKCVVVFQATTSTTVGAYKYWFSKSQTGTPKPYPGTFQILTEEESVWRSKSTFASKYGYTWYGVTMASCQTPPVPEEMHPMDLRAVPQVILIGGE